MAVLGVYLYAPNREIRLGWPSEGDLLTAANALLAELKAELHARQREAAALRLLSQ